MHRPPSVNGKIFADFHAHPSKDYQLEALLKMLSWGITGLASRQDARTVLTYDVAVKFPGVEEVDKGILARLTYNGSTGYFIKAEEVEGVNHVLAIGCKNPVEWAKDSEGVIKNIRKQGGIVVLNHPMFVPDETSLMHYRFVGAKEFDLLRKLALQTDEVESFNAQAIEFIPGVLDFSQANTRAYALARESGHKGMASSDAHYVLEQVKVAGNYFPSDNLCFDAIHHHIKTKDFVPYHQHVSRWSFIKGHSY